MFLFLKRKEVAVILCGFGIVFVLFCLFLVNTSNVFMPKRGYTIVLDAGHGGIDGGVVGFSGSKESDVNLAISHLVGEELSLCGFDVVQTRNDKNGLGDRFKWSKKADMQKRQQIIQEAKANLVVSIHANKYTLSSRSGPQVFFGDDVEGQKLAQKIQVVLNDFTGNKHSALKGDYFMLKCTTSPSVIVECGFLSNPSDEAKLNDEGYQKQFAKVVAKGIMLYLADGVVTDNVV